MSLGIKGISFSPYADVWPRSEKKEAKPLPSYRYAGARRLIIIASGQMTAPAESPPPPSHSAPLAHLVSLHPLSNPNTVQTTAIVG